MTGTFSTGMSNYRSCFIQLTYNLQRTIQTASQLYSDDYLISHSLGRFYYEFLHFVIKEIHLKIANESTILNTAIAYLEDVSVLARKQILLTVD